MKCTLSHLFIKLNLYIKQFKFSLNEADINDGTISLYFTIIYNLINKPHFSLHFSQHLSLSRISPLKADIYINRDLINYGN